MGKTKIDCICSVCNIIFQRSKSECYRGIKKNRLFYCSRKCSGKANINNFGDRKCDIIQLQEYAKEYYNNKDKDCYTPFRQHLRSVKNRNKEHNIDLEYLKNLWEEQKGVCPLTGWNLDLIRKASPNQASLDRIDSNKGYIQGNIRFIALIANLCKSSYDDQQVLEFCKAVVERHPPL